MYLSKFFGWDNKYHFNFHEHGPYSCELSHDYKILSENLSLKPGNMNLELDSMKNFIKNHPTEFLEATSSILYYIKKFNYHDLWRSWIVRYFHNPLVE